MFADDSAALTDIAPDAIADHYARHGLADWSDARLTAAVAQVVARPRIDPADSFVLHAPLEVLARAALLPMVDTARREAARLRLVEVAAKLDAFGEAVPTPATRTSAATVNAATTQLLAALADGDLDAADANAAWLGEHCAPAELAARLGDTLLTNLAAAAHAPIFFQHLPTVSARGEVTGTLLRGLVRELARHPGWTLTWVDEVDAPQVTDVSGLAEGLRDAPLLGNPGSLFIYPMMHAVDGADGAAAQALATVTGPVTNQSAAVVQRAAALQMLTEPSEHAPYGWSHALTLPQAALKLATQGADPTRCLRTAASYVLGARSAMATAPLPESWDEPAAETVPWRAALAGDPAGAGAAVLATSPSDDSDLVTELVSRASAHEDAHLVKYTLSCLDAAASDPGARRLYLAAAATLSAWWKAV